MKTATSTVGHALWIVSTTSLFLLLMMLARLGLFGSHGAGYIARNEPQRWLLASFAIAASYLLACAAVFYVEHKRGRLTDNFQTQVTVIVVAITLLFWRLVGMLLSTTDVFLEPRFNDALAEARLNQIDFWANIIILLALVPVLLLLLRKARKAT